MTRTVTIQSAVVALASVGALAIMGPAVAQADFTPPYTTQCSGNAIEGPGSGLQQDIAGTWTEQFGFTGTSSPASCASTGKEVIYNTSTSSLALSQFGAAGGARTP